MDDQMKLNLGCGFNKLEGWTNVDRFATCQPDVVFDLETTPWIWDANSADSILLNHSLEHMGKDSATFLKIMQELYRISAPDCEIEINVPHPRHDNFLDDPTHVRAITPRLLRLFDMRMNRHWQTTGEPYSLLAIYLNVDFEVCDAQQVPDEPYLGLFQSGSITVAELEKLARENNNVVSEYRIRLKARKSFG